MAHDTKLALATRLVSLYSQVTNEVINPVSLLNNRGEYNRIVEKALTFDNEELIAAALDCADTEGFLCAVYWYSGRKISSPGSVTEAQWETLKNSAINVAGPIGVFVVHQVKDAGQAVDWGSAVNEVSKALGSVGTRFRTDLEKTIVPN
jgi:hypothetical protein